MSKSLQELKALMMHEFAKQNSKVGHVITGRNVMSIQRALNPKEQEMMEPAINELIDENLITYEEGGPFNFTLKLTQSGYDAIYPASDQSYLNNIKEYVLGMAKKRKLKVGQILPFRNLTAGIHQRFNAKEISLFETAIESLISDGYFSESSGSLPSLKLEQKGFDTIY